MNSLHLDQDHAKGGVEIKQQIVHSHSLAEEFQWAHLCLYLISFLINRATVCWMRLSPQKKQPLFSLLIETAMQWKTINSLDTSANQLLCDFQKVTKAAWEILVVKSLLAILISLFLASRSIRWQHWYQFFWDLRPVATILRLTFSFSEKWDGNNDGIRFLALAWVRPSRPWYQQDIWHNCGGLLSQW